MQGYYAIVFLFLISCASRMTGSSDSLPDRDHKAHIAPEERSAMHRVSRYQDIVDEALSKEPGSLDDFLKASILIDYRSSAGSAMHEYYTFPAVIEQWDDAQLAKSCSTLNGAMKKKLLRRMNRSIPDWQFKYPQSHVALKAPQKHHRYR